MIMLCKQMEGYVVTSNLVWFPGLEQTQSLLAVPVSMHGNGKSDIYMM